MNERRDFKGVWIPKALYLDDELSWTEKVVLIEIDSDGGCIATNAQLTRVVGVSADRVSKIITKLKRRGLVRQESFDGRRRTLRCVTTEAVQ